jgi:hypothetical protein
MLSKMHNVLLHLALLTVGAHGLVVGTVLFTVPLYVDRSYVDGSSCVVFIIDTTLPFWTVKCSAYVLLALGGIGVVAVAVALSNLALLVVQEEFRLIFPCSLSALLLGFLLSIVQ